MKSPQPTGVEARSNSVEPSYVVPAEEGVSLEPAVLMLITLPVESKAKLWGAMTALLLHGGQRWKSDTSQLGDKAVVDRVPDELGELLGEEPEVDGEAVDALRDLEVRRQLDHVVEKELPWLPPPPPWSWVVLPLVFGSSAKVVSPELMTASLDPLVGKPASGSVEVAAGFVSSPGGEPSELLVEVRRRGAARVLGLAGRRDEVDEAVEVIVESVGAGRSGVGLSLDLLVVRRRGATGVSGLAGGWGEVDEAVEVVVEAVRALGLDIGPLAVVGGRHTVRVRRAAGRRDEVDPAVAVVVDAVLAVGRRRRRDRQDVEVGEGDDARAQGVGDRTRDDGRGPAGRDLVDRHGGGCGHERDPSDDEQECGGAEGRRSHGVPRFSARMCT